MTGGVLNGAKVRCALPARHHGKHRMEVLTDACSFPGCLRPATRNDRCSSHRYNGKVHASVKPPPKRRPGESAKIVAAQGWEEHITPWVGSLVMRDLSENTVDIRAYHLRRFSNEVGKPPFEVTLDDLTTWCGLRIADGTWSTATAKACRSSLRSFYQWAHKTGRIDHNPAADFPAIRAGERNPKPVEEDDFRAALAASDPRTRMAVRIAGELGLRRAEVAQVHADDLIDTTDGHVLKVLGKGRKTRHIPIPAALAADIRERIAVHGRNGWCFPSPQGGHLTPHWIGSLVTKVLPDGYTMHKLRHRAATKTYELSKDLILTGQLLGHSTVATTQIYVKPDHSKLRGLVEQLAVKETT